MGDKYQSLAERWGTERRPRERRKDDAQLTLDMARTERGGRREGAGRPKALRPNVRHCARVEHRSGTPVHVTLRRAREIPNLRIPILCTEIVRCISDSQRDDFRIVHYSVQADHLHMIVEADAGDALERGMRGFVIRTAKGLNCVLARRGKIWADRYHRHDLRTPTEVRRALVYVLFNGVKHGVVRSGEIDPCSSGPYFDGWVNPLPVNDNDSPPVRTARTWLLAKGWLKVAPGYLFPSEVPQAARA